MGTPGRLRPPALLILAACGPMDWRHADHQLDILGANPGDEERVRICVEGVGMHESTVGEGRVAFAGLPTGGDLMVTVDLFGEDDERAGRAGPHTFVEGEPHATVDWQACTQGDCSMCQTSGDLAEPGTADRLLAIRFEG